MEGSITMGRTPGSFNFPSNLEVRLSEPLDARTKVALKSDLTTKETWTDLPAWQSPDGNVYLYKGIIVSVTDDPEDLNNGVYLLTGDDYSLEENWQKVNISAEEFEDIVYNNPEGCPVSVGGISQGTTFDNVDFTTFVNMLLYPELFGELTDPSFMFSSSVTGLREVGETITSINFVASFNRGLISPQYESESPYRSGAPSIYYFSGEGLVSTSTSV